MKNKVSTSCKNRKWLYGFIGFFVGILVGISVFLLDKYMFKEKLYVYRVFDNLYKPKLVQDTIIHEKTIYVRTEEPLVDSINTDVDEIVHDSLLQWDHDFAEWDDFTGWDDVEFYMQVPEIEEIVVLDKIIRTREISVKLPNSNSEKREEYKPPYTSFEVQQWSTPIRNSITYQNNEGMIKIKGMDIVNVEILFLNGVYYLYDGNQYYTLLDNQNFEKLTVADLPRQQLP